MEWVWKIVRWIVVGLGALIVIAIVAAVVVIDTDWFRDTSLQGERDPGQNFQRTDRHRQDSRIDLE